MGVENEEDLHSDPLFSSRSSLPPLVHHHFAVYWELCFRIGVAFKEHQRYITHHETMIHDAFAKLSDWLRIGSVD